jgi:ParB family transcriptional regulator, chromosome partitioning protein
MFVQHIRCADIHADPCSPGYRDEAVAPLADSVRVFGVLRPIVLRATRNGFVIVHGERRWRAARMLGLEAIPAVVEAAQKNKVAMRASDQYAAMDPIA